MSRKCIVTPSLAFDTPGAGCWPAPHTERGTLPAKGRSAFTAAETSAGEEGTAKHAGERSRASAER